MKKNNNVLIVFLITLLLTFICNFVYAQFADNSFKLKMNNYSKADDNIKLNLNKNFKSNNLKSVNPKPDSGSTLGKYTPNKGFKFVETKYGDVSISIFTYMRYLNQKGLDSTYINSFEDTLPVKRREDIQVNKVNIKFLGWFLDPKFNYFLYVWTSNTSQGLSAQVVVAGWLQYALNKHFIFGAGINSLPGTRSTEGNFPYWLTVDNRLIADEFFRPSYTTGVWMKGKIADKLNYNLMLGNNLSQLGIDAGQLDNGLNTIVGSLTWFPTTGEFGLNSDFGDFEYHEKAATRLGGKFTYSEESRQGQPRTDDFDNVQTRLSDGSTVFKPYLFGPGILIDNLTYKMTCANAGVKYKGFALEGEYYWNWISNFTGTGIDSLGFNLITNNGFQLMLSGMVIKDRLQTYTTFSQVFGDYNNPYEARIGINFFPWKMQAVRWNFEYIQIYKSPTGGLSLPYPVGGTGGIFNTDLMINF